MFTLINNIILLSQSWHSRQVDKYGRGGRKLDFLYLQLHLLSLGPSSIDGTFHQFFSASPVCGDTFYNHFQQLLCPCQLSAMYASTGINSLLPVFKMTTTTVYSVRLMVSHHHWAANSSVFLKTSSVKHFNHGNLTAQLFQCMFWYPSSFTEKAHCFVYTCYYIYITFFSL